MEFAAVQWIYQTLYLNTDLATIAALCFMITTHAQTLISNFQTLKCGLTSAAKNVITIVTQKVEILGADSMIIQTRVMADHSRDSDDIFSALASLQVCFHVKMARHLVYTEERAFNARSGLV